MKNTRSAMLTRRRFASLCVGLACTSVARPTGVLASADARRSLRLHNLHTSDSVSVDYWKAGQYDDEALSRINHVLRDFRSGDVYPIDVGLLDLLNYVSHQFDTAEAFHVISGYRSPATNEKLRRRAGGVARKSLHMKGMAIDVRLPGVPLAELRRVALELRRGGVGYYPKLDFVHLDTGRVRRW